MNLFETLRQQRARVLFVCLGNACRSQIAEAFARAYGADVMEAYSAGVLPAGRISRRTKAAMEEKRVPLADDQAPKSLTRFDLGSFDLIVNLCEYALPRTETQVLKHPVCDPMTSAHACHREVRDEIDTFVRHLVDHFRTAKEWQGQWACSVSPSQN